MDFDEYLKQAKEAIKNTEIVEHKKKDKRQEVYEECNDYYSIPNSKEGFAGDVININGEEFNVLFQKLGAGRDEFWFREKIEKIDQWLSDKPYKVTQHWQKYLPQWIRR
jgi:hypothetical protein